MANDKGGKVLLGAALITGTIATIAIATRPAKAAPGLADVLGSVADHEGFPIAGVSVTLGPYSTSTDEAGSFSLLSIQTGTYTATFSKAGYETVVI